MEGKQVIRTRYRDVPLEDCDNCCLPADEVADRDKWEKLRGQPLDIETPPIANADYFKCNGPFYTIHGQFAAVCPHIAEIGD